MDIKSLFSVFSSSPSFGTVILSKVRCVNAGVHKIPHLDDETKLTFSKYLIEFLFSLPIDTAYDDEFQKSGFPF